MPLEGAGLDPFTRWLSLARLRIARPFLLRRVRRPTVELISGVPVVVLPEVFNPVVFRSGQFLAETVAAAASAAPPASAEPWALDMGTGTGVGAVFAARLGYRVVGVDLNPVAVRCARASAALNGLEDRVEIRHGDLFAPVEGLRFHLVLFNPPFYRGRPRNDRFDLSWRSVDVPERFAAGLRSALAPGGRALIVHSTDGDAPGLLRALAAEGLSVTAIARSNLGNEIMTVYCARPLEDL